LVVDWTLTSSCHAPLEDLFLEPGFNWNIKSLRHILYPNGSYDVNKELFLPFQFDTHVIQNRDPTSDGMICSLDLGLPSDVRTIRIRPQGMWFVAAMMHNKFWMSTICNMFGAKSFQVLAKGLLFLHPKVQKMVDDVKPKFINSSVVSLQIRLMEGNGIMPFQEQVFFRCAQMLSKPNTKWFLATDRIQTREFIIQQLGDRFIRIDQDPTIFFNKETTVGVQTALAEMWLLGEANEIIISPLSTFGDIAHARTGKVPYIVTKNGSCYKLLSTEPCFHAWKSVVSRSCWRDEWYTVDMLNNDNCFF